jgi:hypothetical protein
MIVPYATIDGIKRAAKRRSRKLGIPYTRALDLISREASYSDFRHAVAEYAKSALPQIFPITITQYWRDRPTRRGGTESLQMALSQPLLDLVRPHHFKGYLSGARVEGPHILVGYGAEESPHYAQRELCRYARALQFMDATGLKPSRGSRGYPKGRWAHRKPNSDHDTVWFHPEARIYVVTDEPYPGHTSLTDEKVLLWKAKHGFDVVQCHWHGIYGLGTELYLVGKADGPLEIKDLARKLERRAAITEKTATFQML